MTVVAVVVAPFFAAIIIATWLIKQAEQLVDSLDEYVSKSQMIAIVNRPTIVFALVISVHAY